MSLIGRSMALPMVLVFTAAAALTIVASPKSMSASTAQPFALNQPVASQQVRRIHAHFDSVLSELAGADVAALSSEASLNRNRLTQTLNTYNARGDFPHNYDFSKPTPYFVDRQTGTLCAVAFLLESTGRRDIVDRVAAANNNVWVAELKGDSAFTSWLDAQGITLDEAARIQVPYESSSSRVANGVLMVAAPLTLATSLATTTWNAWGNRDGHNRFGSHTGLATNIVVTTLGASFLYWSRNTEGAVLAGTAVTAIGAVGTGIAIRSMLHRPAYLAAKREKENTRRADFDASISPILPIGKDAGTGLSMSIRF